MANSGNVGSLLRDFIEALVYKDGCSCFLGGNCPGFGGICTPVQIGTTGINQELQHRPRKRQVTSWRSEASPTLALRRQPELPKPRTERVASFWALTVRAGAGPVADAIAGAGAGSFSDLHYVECHVLSTWQTAGQLPRYPAVKQTSRYKCIAKPLLMETIPAIDITIRTFSVSCIAFLHTVIETFFFSRASFNLKLAQEKKKVRKEEQNPKPAAAAS